jgi:hypothetical protein
MKKITIVKNEADRITNKIEDNIEKEDLNNYRFKQGLGKWEANTKVSQLRVPSNQASQARYE